MTGLEWTLWGIFAYGGILLLAGFAGALLSKEKK